MNEWISVKDRLPESDGHYLCTDGNEIQIMAYFGEYKGSYDWSSYMSNTIDVTHWMPLPKAPEEK